MAAAALMRDSCPLKGRDRDEAALVVNNQRREVIPEHDQDVRRVQPELGALVRAVGYVHK
jgi:hypothetical protein